MLRCILCARLHGRGLPNQDEMHFVGWVWSKQGDMHFVCSLALESTHVEMFLVSSLALESFGQHMLSYLLCPRWQGMGLIITCCDAFCVFAGIGQHKLRYILCRR
jgi:hypothetical protein